MRLNIRLRVEPTPKKNEPIPDPYIKEFESTTADLAGDTWALSSVNGHLANRKLGVLTLLSVERLGGKLGIPRVPTFECLRGIDTWSDEKLREMMQ